MRWWPASITMYRGSADKSFAFPFRFGKYVSGDSDGRRYTISRITTFWWITLCMYNAPAQRDAQDASRISRESAGRLVILAKEFYPRRKIPIRRVKRNGYRVPRVSSTSTRIYIPPSPVEMRANEQACARVYSTRRISKCASVRFRSTCIKKHRIGKSYFLALGRMKIDPPHV